MGNSHDDIDKQPHRTVHELSEDRRAESQYKAITALTAAVRSPIRILKESPATVRTNMSRPIQSVPKGYCIHGARFFLVKSVLMAASCQNLPSTAMTANSTAARIRSAKLCILRFFFISASPPL